MQYVLHRFHIARGFSFELHRVKKSISYFGGKYQKFTKKFVSEKNLQFSRATPDHFLIVVLGNGKHFGSDMKFIEWESKLSINTVKLTNRN